MDNKTIIHNLSEVIARMRNIKSSIDRITSDEETYMWNIPENLQESDRYYAADEAVDNLYDAGDCVDDAYNDAMELLEELQE